MGAKVVLDLFIKKSESQEWFIVFDENNQASICSSLDKNLVLSRSGVTGSSLIIHPQRQMWHQLWKINSKTITNQGYNPENNTNATHNDTLCILENNNELTICLKSEITNKQLSEFELVKIDKTS